MFSSSHGCQAIASVHDGGTTYTPLPSARSNSSSVSTASAGSPSLTVSRTATTLQPRFSNTLTPSVCRSGVSSPGKEPPRANTASQSARLPATRASASRTASYLTQWGIHLTQVAPRRCGLVDPWTPAHCTQNAPWGARRRSAGNWATRLRFGPIKDYARAMAIAGLETWCYRQAFPGAANGQPQYVVVT